MLFSRARAVRAVVARRTRASFVALAMAAGSVALAACQGNIGNGGMSLPGMPTENNPQGPSGGGATQSRQRVVEGAVYLGSELKEIPLPDVDGFSVALELGSPAPASPSPAASSRPHKGKGGALAGTLTVASPAPSASIAPSAAPSPTAGSRSTASPGPQGSPKGPKITTKTTIYPDDAPAAPSPQPSGDVQTYAVRKAIVRGYVLPATPLNLYGLGAVRFTVPAGEQKDGRGFTIALFEEGRRHHSTLVTFDAGAKVAGDAVTVGDARPLVLKKDTGYVLMLYGDELPATPAPVESGYPTPGNNPFPMPSGYTTGAPAGYPQQPGMPVQPPPYATPNSSGTTSPYGPPNPYGTTHP